MTTAGHKKRSLKNLRLTEKYRFQYLGHWMLVCFLFLVLLNVAIYAVYEQIWLLQAPAGVNFAVERMHHNMQVAGTLIAISGFFGMAILLLAIFTAHRIGGPFIALKRTMAAVEQGNYKIRLHFRGYDKLDDVEAAFNTMMDALQARLETEVPPSTSAHSPKAGTPSDAHDHDGPVAKPRESSLLVS
jgi:HAMP domain-containing protein